MYVPPMADYNAPVLDSTRAFTRFASELVDQLDVEGGSFRCWHGHTDYQRLALIADYLIQSTTGVADALADAALCAAEHREQLFADNYWLVRAGKSVFAQNPNASHEDFVRGLQRGTREERRERRVAISGVDAMVHLVQALDRLAAVVIVVAGLGVEVLKAGWPALERYAVDEDKKGKIFNAPLEMGRDAQRSLLKSSLHWTAHGPADWLPWMMQTRHASAHRAATSTWNFTTVDKRGRMTGTLRPFLRQPSMSEMHSLSYGPDSAVGAHTLGGLLVIEDSADVLDGLVRSMNDFTLHVLGEVEALWLRRQNDPSLVVQPGTQWKLKPQRRLAFTGYGNAVLLQDARQLTVGPGLSKRLQASKIMDDDRRDFWESPGQN